MRASIHHFAFTLLIFYPLQVLASSVSKGGSVSVKTGASQTSSGGQLVPREGARVSNPYEALIAKKDYKGIAERGKHMTKDVFIRDLCPLMTTLDHYHGLGGINGFMESHDLIPSFLAHGNIKLVRKVMAGDGVKPDYFIGNMNSFFAFILSFKNQNYGRFIDLLTVEEQNHVESRRKGELLNINCGKEICAFYKYVDAVNNMQFKHFLLRHGEDLNGKYPVTFKTVCEELANRLRGKTETFKDFLGQPFPFPPSAIIEVFYTSGRFIANDFLDIAPREAFEEWLTEPRMKVPGKDLWVEIVKKFPGTDPTFPPSRETRERVLGGFPTKCQMEMAWIKKNIPDHEAVIATKRKGIAACISSSLVLLPTVLVKLTVGYIPLTCSWLDLPAK